MVVIRSCRGAAFKDGHPALAATVAGQHGITGKVQANRWGPAQACEQWELCLLDGAASDAKPLSVSAADLEQLEGPVRVGLRAHHGGWLGANSEDGSVSADARELLDWETWTLEKVPGRAGRFTFRSFHGKYFIREGHNVVANRDHAREWEEWYITDDAHDHTRPGTTARRAVWGTLVALGTVATGGFLAVPLVGFTSAGVAAGSAAAAAQSAIYGAATAGAFSVLQSIGATGAWVTGAMAGTGVAATGGVALGLEEDAQMGRTHLTHNVE
eukprot:jgi/Tetstr1/421540/TSEL_012487.t1